MNGQLNPFIVFGVLFIILGVAGMTSMTAISLAQITLPFNITVETPLLLSFFSTVIGMVSLGIGISTSRFMKRKVLRRRGR